MASRITNVEPLNESVPMDSLDWQPLQTRPADGPLPKRFAPLVR